MAAISGQTLFKPEFAQWTGLKSSVKQSAASCKAGCALARPVTIRAQASGSEEAAQLSNAAAPAQSEALFASVSANAPAPSAATPGAAFAAAGALVGAASYYAFTKLGGKAPADLPVPPPVADSLNGAATKFVKRAAPAALATISHYFPNAMQDESFVHACGEELFNLGFTKDNCIALVNTCRDEVCRPLVNIIDKEFGLSFNIAGLGGLVNCGKTGFKAGFSHSPEFPCDVDGKPRERYVFFAFPHVSIGESGEVGSLLRRGRGKPSSACGALIAIKNDAKAGAKAEEDELDAEYITLKKKVLEKPICKDSGPAGPSLVDVTKAALQVISDDLEHLISKTVNPETSDYAVITGVQIHSGAQVPGEPFRIERTVDYIAPGIMYAVIRGEKYVLHCEVNQITSLKSLSADLIAA